MSQVTTAKKPFLNIRTMTQIALLAALAGVLMLFETPLPFAPSFYKLDLSELPVLIGALSLGPLAGVMIELIKVMLNFAMNGTITGGVGEAANFIIGCAFIVPVAIVYQRNKTMKSLVVGFGLGIVTLAIVGAVANYLVLLPVYSMVFGQPLEYFVQLGNVLNPYITDLETLVLYAVVPFNLVKGILLSILSYLLFKRVGHRLIK